MEDRIRKIIEYYGLNVRQFEQKISASEGQIYKYLSRGGGLNSDTLSKILDKCQEISPDWLLLGRGEMLRSATQSVGNIAHSTAVGVNVNGNDINISNNTQQLVDTIARQAETIARQAAIIDRLTTPQ